MHLDEQGNPVFDLIPTLSYSLDFIYDKLSLDVVRDHFTDPHKNMTLEQAFEFYKNQTNPLKAFFEKSKPLDQKTLEELGIKAKPDEKYFIQQR